MKKQLSAIFAIWMLHATTGHAQVITMEDVNLPVGGYLNTMPFVSQGALFNNDYNSTFQSWGGFAASDRTDVTTPGYFNQYSAYHLPGGGGDASLQFAVAYQDPFTPTTPTITLPAGTRPSSVRLTNNTYAALSMRDGDGFAKKFGGMSGNDPDYFYVTITGRQFINGPVTGFVNFYLADYRSANNSMDYIVSQWSSVDLTALNNAAVIDFTFTSTDVGAGGINTPTYLALDNLVVTPVPEPGALLLGLFAISVAQIKRLTLIAAIGGVSRS